jgi:RHS repeat-associated protein
MRTNGSVYYGYDWASRLTAYTNGSTTATMIYAADGNRSQRTSSGTTTLYLVATVNPSGYPQVVEEFTVSGGTTNLSMVYSYGLGLISQRQAANGTVNFFGSDGLGSTRFLTSTNGTITESYAYDAFGTLIASNTTPSTVYLFTGQQTDPVLGGLLNLRQRHNITTLGRFLTRDAVQGNVQEPLSLHQYVYVANNPANNVDPSGNAWLDATRLGTAVHQFIGKDFLKKTPQPAFSGRAIATALKLPDTITPFLPDLVDVPRTQVYEIKPNGIISFAAGEAQLQTYLDLFHALDPLKRKWKGGSSYTAPPLFLVSAPLVPPTFVETEPPIFGVILYSSIQDYVKRKARNVAVEENAEMDDSVGISVLDAFLGGLF